MLSVVSTVITGIVVGLASWILYAEYDRTRGPDCCEVDHLIPLELGGSLDNRRAQGWLEVSSVDNKMERKLTAILYTDGPRLQLPHHSLILPHPCRSLHRARDSSR